MWVVVLAGGRGERLKREVNKVYLPVAGREIIEFSLSTFVASPLVEGIVVVARHQDVDHLRSLLASIEKSVEVVEGGATRHQSEHRGIAAAVRAGRAEWVAVHDGARPFITHNLLDAIAAEAERRGGAIPVVPVAGPLYQSGERGVELLDTASVRRAQTPQIFRAEQLWAGFRAAEEAGFEGVDTAETVERFTDLQVGVVEGDPRNIKVTFVEDLLQAEDLAGSFRDGRWVVPATEW